MNTPPVLVVHLYTRKARTRILNRLKAEQRPPGTQVFLGTYGINRRDAAAISAAAIPGVHYAPAFHLAPVENAELRRARPRPPKGSPPLDPAFAGQFPEHPQEPHLPAANPRAWGVELGRRFRDQLRQAEKEQARLITTWQLDEIPPECATDPRSREFRLFLGGVIRGLAEGRPKLGDKVKPGLVWIAADALRTLPGAPLTADVKQFWEDVNAGAKYLVGEEYPQFVRGAAAATANALAGPQKALAARGSKPREALAKRYIVGMTPGWHKPRTSGLHGNIGNMKLPAVTEWRNEFITARTKAQRPCGYGMFHFDGDFNTLPARIDNAVAALHVAARKHAEP